MTMPGSVPARAYLLAFDRDRGRLAGRLTLGYTLRAAALADLRASGHFVDAAGKVATAPGARPPHDPVLRAVWDEVADGRPRSWGALIKRGRGPLESAIRDHLAAGGWIRVTRERRLLRPARIEMRDPRVLTRATAALSSTLRGPMPIARLDPRDVALLAVLAAGNVRTALPKATRREHADRIAQAITRTDPVPTALKHAISQASSSS